LGADSSGNLYGPSMNRTFDIYGRIPLIGFAVCAELLKGHHEVIDGPLQK
jgi:hypothetical protein